ncbi:aldehyde dehydrogenase family protein [Pseudonocardia sp. TRM90224]|uniref:aldehyde dehydrogenase family protein n=1 Tax=Pseudonocardia sp. TRM90224 TaxID=2812678 RepID=UPI001E421171|nr:aldehyde dehydrogenase family protein [Pseudonocardia sp. TRM90224]
MTTTRAGTFESVDPATGEVIATFPVLAAADVEAAVARARAAQPGWDALGYASRARVLRAWRSLIMERADELADLVHRENGKPLPDALIEVVLVAQHIDYAARHARKVLGRRRVSSGPMMLNHVASVEYRPLGVIGVLGPWDYPVFGPVGTGAYALAGGNTVVLKHSEHTPAIGEWLARTFAEVSGDGRLLQNVTGAGETGAALCRAGVDKISFTGCVATAKKVLAACAESLTPVLVDAGASDTLLVDADADLDAAADAAVWGSMSNAGQICISLERAYVHERVHDAFLEKVVALAGRLRAGEGEKLGPITMPGQQEIIRAHVADALDRGARAVVGGLASIGERYVQPIVLADVPEEARVIQEETFGPVLAVVGVSDMDEALRRANAPRFGLGGAVFSRSRGVELARGLRSGMTSVNSVATYAGIPSLPYGGVGNSGFGRIHGPDGLREWTAPKAISRQLFPGPVRTTTFRRRAADERRLAGLARLLYGRG